MTKANVAASTKNDAAPTKHQQGIDLLDPLYTMKPAELRSRWREVYRSVAPDIGPDLLRRGIAYRLQERGQGSLTSSTRREIERQIKRLGRSDGVSVSTPSLKPGTRLVRSWRGKMHQILVLEDGFEFDGRRYGSLTQIASDITGAHWSGPRFFGLLAKSRGEGDDVMTLLTRKRCAIYTRKSTEEGLEMDFNSLDAQREACAAYILSQAGEGWETVHELYDDGGWSGGSMDRPALRQLLDDIQAGKVDIVVVYKVDRLTRSLADFAKIVEILDARGASFVSVTQAFNTTNSMGRLTLNVLLSFAQFEREVTGERIRDKIAASKRKGMWMGGTVPHGYRVEDRKLVIEPEEDEEVRYIFNRYLELKSVPALVDDLARRGMRTRTRHRKAGGTIGNVYFGKGPLGFLLKNPVFIGKIRHKDSVYDGEHDPIIDPDTFDRVQTILASNNRDKLIARHAKSPSLLSGLITDPDGRPMSPVRGQKGSKQYCYYVTRFKAGEDRFSICRIPAGALEKIVIDSFASYLRRPAQADQSTCKVEWQSNRVAEAALADSFNSISTSELRAVLIDHKVTVQIADDRIAVKINKDQATITIAAQLVRRGNELRIALPPDGASTNTNNTDPALVRLVVQGFAAREHLLNSTEIPTISDYDKRHLHRLARISWLAPDIITAILDGRQSVQLTARHLLRCADIPLEWQQQRHFLGFS